MKNSLAALTVGFVFALGLGLAGMTQPQNVVGFLDLFGHWNPSLMFVMIGAIAVHSVAQKIIRKRKAPIFSKVWHVPENKEITGALMIGAFIFGVGWGLGGFCPGPAFASLATLETRPVVFVISMLVGMTLFNQINKKIKIKR